MQHKYEPRPIQALDRDLGKAIKKRKRKEKIYDSLPKIDCGICGAPTCLAFAEDVVKGDAKLSDCIFKIPQKYKKLIDELNSLLNGFVYITKEEEHNRRDNNIRKKS
jgi:CO dehydrogenase/acetyl-CoA synthase gamma subunit (corrinoid Fe-S protein)